MTATTLLGLSLVFVGRFAGELGCKVLGFRGGVLFTHAGNGIGSWGGRSAR